MLVVRPTHHPKARKSGVINRVWVFDGVECPEETRVRADVTFDDGYRTTIAAYCLRTG